MVTVLAGDTQLYFPFLTDPDRWRPRYKPVWKKCRMICSLRLTTIFGHKSGNSHWISQVMFEKKTYILSFTRRYFMLFTHNPKKISIIYTGDNRWAQLSIAPTFKMASIRVRCIRGPVKMVLVNVTTRINVRYSGMPKQHIGIMLPGGNTNSLRRKRPD